MKEETNEEVLICPKCGPFRLAKMSAGYLCGDCRSNFSNDNGYIDLRLDASQDTKLDHATYDENHNINREGSLFLYDVYSRIFADCGANTAGSLLEIACGSGHLTTSLFEKSSFTEFHVSDLSPQFMRMTQSRLKDYPNFSRANFYLFDANTFPFKNDMFDVVAGNSVLHHFKFFEKTLRESFRVLKKGGVAVYGEPILDTGCYVSLAAALIYEIDNQLMTSKLKKQTSDLLLGIGRISEQKRINLDSDRLNLEEIEDKFEFPTAYMRKLATEIGFSSSGCVTPTRVENFGQLIKSGLYHTFSQHRLDVSEIEQFSFIFDSIEKTYGKAMRDFQNSLFDFFYFKK